MDAKVRRIQLALQALKRGVESELPRSEAPAVTRPQMFLLYEISRQGRCNLTHLADVVEVKPSAITVMIDRLEREGHVRRSHDPADRRVILVELTPQGKEVLASAIQIRNAILQRYISRLEPHEIDQFVTLLEKITNR
jgi:MarR family transcriptional regulator, organic hydroperoxide resistance regulator